MHRFIFGLVLLQAAGSTFTELPIEDISFYPQKSNCTGYHALLNYKRSLLHIMPITNTKRILWTDIRHEECLEAVTALCLMRAKICGVFSGPAAVTITINTCVDDIYVYIWDPDSVGQLPNVEMLVQYTNTSAACDSVVNNEYTYCGALSQSDCDVCGGRCRTAGCYTKKSHSLQTSLCLPSNTSSGELSERCRSLSINDHGAWVRSCDMTEHTEGIGLFPLAFVTVLILLLIGLCVPTVWYNLLLTRSGVAPLTCPRYCPELLFPHGRIEPAEVRDTYRPPVFYSDL